MLKFVTYPEHEKKIYQITLPEAGTVQITVAVKPGKNASSPSTAYSPTLFSFLTR